MSEARDEGWWCWECHGLGGWDEDGADRGDFGDTVYIDCPCCDGDGWHYGEEPPECSAGRAYGNPRLQIIDEAPERYPLPCDEDPSETT